MWHFPDEAISDQLIHLNRDKGAAQVQLRCHLAYANLKFGIGAADHDQGHVLGRRQTNERSKSAARLIQLAPKSEEIVEQSAKPTVAGGGQQLRSCQRQLLLLDWHEALFQITFDFVKKLF